MELADLFGYAGIFTGTSFMLPQLYKMWRTHSVEDLSWGMLVLFFFNCVFWLAYGFLTTATPVAVVNGVALLIALAQLYLKLKYSSSRQL
ncbi:MAG: hypothetical protein HYS26_04050 [Candidatus Kaiserbacteria bacterium]|nr:MAG: hypothetical protein HYS26_04050 [Candidatus Kaiserbacteria bacterium]